VKTVATSQRYSHTTKAAADYAAGTVFCAILLAATISIAPAAQADANRFAHAQRTVVPASKFSRHYDNESVSSDGSSYSVDASAAAGADSSYSAASPPPKTSGKYGLIPPPPPLTPTILPPGSSAFLLPPASSGMSAGEPR